MTFMAKSEQNWLHRMWREWRSLIVFLIVMVMFRSAIADWNSVPSGSMEPTILVGDRVVVNKIAYDLKVPLTTRHVAEWGGPTRGDIVTFYSPLDERLLIKRVVGVPGDIVEMRNNSLEINGEPASYAPLPQAVYAHLDAMRQDTHTFLVESVAGIEHPVMMLPGNAGEYGNFEPITIPQSHYMMLGDNRDNSADSRRIGFVHRNRITGRAHTIAFSVDYDRWYLPRLDRFVEPLL